MGNIASLESNESDAFHSDMFGGGGERERKREGEIERERDKG